MFLDALPLLPNGKLNRLALPDPGNCTPSGSGWYHDNFLDLGGHSLAATRVVPEVIKRFHLELPLQWLFQSSSVAEMATVIAQYQGKMLGEEELARILTELEINVGRGSEAARRYQSPNKKVRNLYE